MLFTRNRFWDQPGEPLAEACIRMWGKAKELITGKPQFVAGNYTPDETNGPATDCRVIANPNLFSKNYSVWIEQRYRVDGPGTPLALDYYDTVSFKRAGIMSSEEMKTLVAKFKDREGSRAKAD